MESQDNSELGHHQTTHGARESRTLVPTYTLHGEIGALHVNRQTRLSVVGAFLGARFTHKPVTFLWEGYHSDFRHRIFDSKEVICVTHPSLRLRAAEQQQAQFAKIQVHEF